MEPVGILAYSFPICCFYLWPHQIIFFPFLKVQVKHWVCKWPVVYQMFLPRLDSSSKTKIVPDLESICVTRKSFIHLYGLYENASWVHTGSSAAWLSLQLKEAHLYLFTESHSTCHNFNKGEGDVFIYQTYPPLFLPDLSTIIYIHKWSSSVSYPCIFLSFTQTCIGNLLCQAQRWAQRHTDEQHENRGNSVMEKTDRQTHRW